MWRYLVGMLAGVLLMGGGLLWWQNRAIASHGLPEAPAPLAAGTANPGDEEVPEPPLASEKTREQKRFSRYDHDKNGAVSREEFLAARRKAFAKLDTDHDGKLSFDEYAVKTETRFADADGDKNGTLTPAEFATTRIARKAHATPRCAPEAAPRREDAEDN